MENRKTQALIDSGSMVTCIFEDFYNTLDSVLELHNFSDFGSEITSATGSKIRYKGSFSRKLFLLHSRFSYAPTDYSNHISVIIGKNFIRICRESQSTRDVDDHRHPICSQ